MNCDACVGHVTRALKAVPGVHAARVDLIAGQASVEHDDQVDAPRLVEAVREEDYDAEPIPK